MLRLRVVQAEFGDCLILEYGSAEHPRFVLIDGGPEGTYQNHLRFELERIRQTGACLDLVVLSHVDNDHIIGLLALFVELDSNRSAHQPDFISISGLWHNAFERTMGAGSKVEAAKIRTSFAVGSPLLSFLPNSNAVAFGISEGSKLIEADDELGIPLNAGFPGGLVTVDAAPQPVQLNGLSLRILGPSIHNLNNLQKDWTAWLQKVESQQAKFASPVEADKVDRSVPNLSSIMFLASDGERRILLTGDGLGANLLDGVKQAGLLDANGKLHVDVFKLPHHGSVRNISRNLFNTITADVYVVSANGKYNNPDLATLIWLVEAAKAQGRKVQIIATNPTDATTQIQNEYPPAEYGYELTFLPEGEHSIVV